MSTTSPARIERGLVRAIGVRGLTANIVNTTIGAGIFVLPALVARDLGTAAPLAYLACGLAMTLVVASFAIAGSRVSLTGGIYAYVEVAFGPFIGFLTGVLVWLACLLAAAGVASALASAAGLVVPGAGAGLGKALLVAVVYGAFAVTNVRGVTMGTRVVEVATVVKLLPLLLLVAVGMFQVDAADLAVRIAPASEIGTASITLIFAFVGVEIALIPSGEIRDPARTVPRALFFALAITTVLYLALQLVAHATLGESLATFTDAPLAEVASRVLGGWGYTLMLAGAVVSMLGFLSGDALGSPRSLFAFARDGLLPPALARLHPRYHTPATAILTHAVIVWAAASVGTFGVLAVLSNVALLTSYLFCCAAAIELRRRNVQAAGMPFSVPGGPLIPAAACLVLAWLLWHATGQELAVTAATTAVAAALYGLRAWRGRVARASEGTT
jgi:amino acid transporter